MLLLTLNQGLYTIHACNIELTRSYHKCLIIIIVAQWRSGAMLPLQPANLGSNLATTAEPEVKKRINELFWIKMHSEDFHRMQK